LLSVSIFISAPLIYSHLPPRSFLVFEKPFSVIKVLSLPPNHPKSTKGKKQNFFVTIRFSRLIFAECGQQFNEKEKKKRKAFRVRPVEWKSIGWRGRRTEFKRLAKWSWT
jgi:hypothetical protein